MKTTLATLCSFLSLAATAFSADKPNIILIYADDISARELSLYGSSKTSSASTSRLHPMASQP